MCAALSMAVRSGAGRGWALGIALVATAVLLAAPTVSAMRVGPSSTTWVFGYGVCGAQNGHPCSVTPRGLTSAGYPYYVVVIVHGPGAKPGVVYDSQHDPFTNVSYCWLNNLVFGHTEILVAPVVIANPSGYTVTLGPGAAQQWMQVVVVQGHGVTDVTNTCANHLAYPGTVTASYVDTASSSLAVVLFDFINRTPLTCSSGSAALLGPCGTSVSGPFHAGLSTPGVAYEAFQSVSVPSNQSPSISFSGGDCSDDVIDNDGCPWMYAVVGVLP